MTSYIHMTSLVTLPFNSAKTISYAFSFEMKPVSHLVFMGYTGCIHLGWVAGNTVLSHTACDAT